MRVEGAILTVQQKPRPAESPLSASPLQPEPCLHRPPPTNSSPPSSPAATPLNRIQIISNHAEGSNQVHQGGYMRLFCRSSPPSPACAFFPCPTGVDDAPWAVGAVASRFEHRLRTAFPPGFADKRGRGPCSAQRVMHARAPCRRSLRDPASPLSLATGVVAH